MLLPTFHLPGNCNEAIAFYQKAVGAEIKNIAYAKDAPADEVEGVPPNFVIHSEILILGTQIGLTDMGEKQLTDEQFMFTVLLDSDEEVTAVFNKLADGGKIIEPLAPQFWTSLNGSIEDPFGISWNIGTRAN